MDISDISSMLEIQMKVETDGVKENVTPVKDQMSSTTKAFDPISQDENNFYKLMFGNDIASVRFRRIHCTACDTHIGSAPSQIHNMFEHPVLRTLLCADCHDFYGDGKFEQGDDATDMFCRWCANGGNLYCCSYCSNTFCYKCIRRNFTSLVRKKIEADEKWKCFVCNPSDLYSARAICWALLQHVQTVTRILKNDKTMSIQERDDKMNLDESPCCPRRNKRRRRRFESNSDEEDDTYLYKPNGLPMIIKRKQATKKSKPSYNPNGVTRQLQPFVSNPIPILPRPIPFQGEQTFQIESPRTISIECENSMVNPSETIILPSPSAVNSNTPLTSRYDSNALQKQSSLYHTTFMNSAGSSTYIQTPAAINAQAHQIILSQSTKYQQSQPTTYKSSASSQPMVSIPADKHGRPRFLLPKPRELDITLTPNIIELDSDSDDDLKIVEPRDDSTNDRNTTDSSNKVVPVALTWENSDDDDIVKEEQPLVEISISSERNISSFNDTILPHSRELDKLLSNVKEKMYTFFDLDNTIQDIESAAQKKIEKFYRNMRDTVFHLAHINDRIVRGYNEWRTSRKMQIEAPSSTDENTLVSREKVPLNEIENNISLDMICVNDSDTESDCREFEYQTIKPSEFVENKNIVKDLLFFKKKLVHCGVGDDSVYVSADKTTQVYDVVSRDYEKCISHSVLMKTDKDSKTNEPIAESKATSDENYGNYEEQFIFYLQHIEDYNDSSETEDVHSLVNLDGAPLETLETNSSFPLHLLQNVDSPVSSTDQQVNCREEERISKNHINSMTKKISTTPSTMDKDENKKIIDTSYSDTEMQETNVQLDKKLSEIHSNVTNEEAILIMSNNDEAMLIENDAISAQVIIGDKENSTIIDD